MDPAPAASGRGSARSSEEGSSSTLSSSSHPGLSLPSPLRLRGFRHDHHPMHHAAPSPPLQDKPSPRRTSHKRGATEKAQRKTSSRVFPRSVTPYRAFCGSFREKRRSPPMPWPSHVMPAAYSTAAVLLLTWGKHGLAYRELDLNEWPGATKITNRDKPLSARTLCLRAFSSSTLN
jgi:hypothetical protein